jgi:hypothetical protein
VNDSSTQQAMRDMRRVLGRPRTFGGLGLAAVLVTIVQPFGFHVPGPIGLTLMYWLLIIAVTFPLGFVISAACAALFRHRWSAALAAACAMGIAVTVLAYALNIMFLGWGIWELERWRVLIGSAAPVAALITILIHMIQAPVATASSPPQSPKAPVPPRCSTGCHRTCAARSNIYPRRIIIPVSQPLKAAALCCCGFLTRCRRWHPPQVCKCTVPIGSALMPLTKPSAEGTVPA